MQAKEMRIVELVEKRLELMKDIENGTYSASEVADTQQDIEDELQELRQSDPMLNLFAHRRERNARLLRTERQKMQDARRDTYAD